MTTQQPEAQQNYLAELAAIADALNGAQMRLHALMAGFSRGNDTLPEEWHDCYRAMQPAHLAAQLVRVARDNEVTRTAPVLYVPAEAMADLADLMDGS